MKDLWDTLRQTGSEFFDDHVPRLSAALAYYSIFSLAPLLLIAISIAGVFFGDDAASGVLDDQLKSSMGETAAAAVQEMLASTRKPADNLVATLTGLVLLVVGAGGVFGQLQDALNTVWGISPKPGRGLKGMIKDRFLSFSMVLGIGFLLLTSLALTAFLQGASDLVGRVLPLHPLFWSTLSAVVAFLIVTALFAAILKILPDADIGWRDVAAGAVFTSVLFSLGKFALGWYLGREATSSSYGSAGSLVLILLWVYYSSTILLLGAEFTQVHANRRGRRINPTSGAIRTGKFPPE
ncbi:MAG: YihY/virulence factor BrkB family protein [Verrucomicrobiaceae bacterium]|nr:MAG: YihY/virulence factor BrkB family protein [Verrucomicrobiaceae bacterium]